MAGYYKVSEQVVNEPDAIKKAKEDQELWDKVAIAALQGIIAAYRDDSVSNNVAHSFEYADTFMAERARGMELVIREG